MESANRAMMGFAIARSYDLLQNPLRDGDVLVPAARGAPSSEWSKTFTDPRLAAAADRITYRAHIIQTGTVSYRLNNR